jgi:hypothetical protein
MIPPRDLPNPFDDVEKPHPLVADSADGAPSQPLAVRLGDLWADLLRVDDGASDPESRSQSRPAMALLDHMKGVMEWD